MVVQEIEAEINYTDSRQEEISRLSEIELLRARLDDELNQRKSQLNLLERRLDKNGVEPDQRAAVEEEQRQAKAELERIRRSVRVPSHIAHTPESDAADGFDPFWGSFF